MADFRELFAVLLLVTQFILAIPIVLRIARKRSDIGVSLVGEGTWVIAGVGWLVYGLNTGSLALTISGLLAALTSGLIIVMLRQQALLQWRTLIPAVSLVTTALVLGFHFGGVFGLGIALAVFGVIQFLPQGWLSLTMLINRAPAVGVSALGSLLRAIYAGGWALYAGAWPLWGFTVAEINLPLVAWGLAGMITFSLQYLTARRGEIIPRSEKRAGL